MVVGDEEIGTAVGIEIGATKPKPLPKPKPTPDSALKSVKVPSPLLRYNRSAAGAL